MEVFNGLDFVRARAALAAAAASIRLEQVHGHARAADSSDDDEPTDAVSAEAPVACHISYANAAGERSDRIVTIRSLRPSSSALLATCWCHKRKAVRSFRVDRIEEVICIATGEVFSNPYAFFKEVGLQEPRYAAESAAIHACLPELNLLAVVGAADGIFDPDEQDILVSHVYDVAETLDLDESVLRRKIAVLSPDETAYGLSMQRLTKQLPGRRSMFRRTLRHLIDVDGICSPEEQLFAAEIEHALAGAQQR